MNILLIEDDSSIANGIMTALARAHYSTTWINHGGQALAHCQPMPTSLSQRYGVVILDLGLPQVDGTTILSAIRQSGDRVPILILSARDAITDRIQGLEWGADDYLVKPFDMNELLARIRVIERRNKGLEVQSMSMGALTMDFSSQSATWQGHDIDLPRREFMLLKVLIQYPKKVFTRAQLEEQLYQDEIMESNSLDVHVHNIRKKTCKSIITTLRGIGYRFGLS